MIRTFFGLELPADIVMQIAAWREQRLACSGRPTPPANFHITLAFVGEIAPQRLERLCQSVDEWLERKPQHGSRVALDQTGFWPKPGIFWVGPQLWPTPLSQLAKKLRHLSTAAGARLDRNPFQPHVTLFRNCDGPVQVPGEIPDFSLHYEHFTLFESRQGKSGVSYQPLHHWDLPPFDGRKP